MKRRSDWARRGRQWRDHGYNTMDAPAKEYLRNIGVQLVVQNITDRHGQYQYRISTGGGNPCTCDTGNNLMGRIVSLLVSKQW
jgi:hypothetical protein